MLYLEPIVENNLGAFSRGSKQIKLAIKRALRNTLRHARVLVQRELAKSGVKRKAVRKYRRIFTDLQETSGELWVGLNPLPLHELGGVKQGAGGVSVGGKTYQGTFYKAIYSGTKKVWVRSKRNVSAGHTPYNPRRKYKSFGGKVSSGRFPIEVVADSADVETIDSASFLQRIADYFEKQLKHEISYQLSKL